MGIPAAEKITCGIAGWSYADWNGYVYDSSVKDKLRFLAEYVDLIEINSTFYRPPDPKTAASWARRTDDVPGFQFSAKLHQDVTHGPSVDPLAAKAFNEGLRPLVDAGKLRHLLAQFRWDFADTQPNRDRLAQIREHFGEVTNLTLELRHNSWQSPRALDHLRSLGVSVANLDYPLARNSFNLLHCDVGDHAYLRLHGRNADAWFDKKAGRDETYNYAYSEKEVDEIVDRAAVIANMSKSLTLVANNHYQGKEAMNALEIKAKLSGRKVKVPPRLLEKYPRLGRIAQ